MGKERSLLGKKVSSSKLLQRILSTFPALECCHLKVGMDPSIKNNHSQACWCTLLILSLKRQRQADSCEFKTNVFYIENSRLARAIQ